MSDTEDTTTTSLVLRTDSPAALMRQATDVASVCRAIVLATAQRIQGGRHVRVEGWRAIARAFGCTISCRDVEKIDGGWRAYADVKRISDGLVLASGEGFVGEDEKMWMGRPLHARRAMAQTRAASRAGKTAFDFVVTLIDAGLSTTPAEEMMGGGEAVDALPTGHERVVTEQVDPATGEVVEVPVSGTVGETVAADYEAALANLKHAASAKEAAAIMNKAPPHVRKRLMPVYRERWSAQQ